MDFPQSPNDWNKTPISHGNTYICYNFERPFLELELVSRTNIILCYWQFNLKFAFSHDFITASTH